MTDRPAIIIVAYSARALASAANQAGYAPLSIDVFGDEDTREASFASMKLEGGLSDGLKLDKVVGAVETLISAYHPIGLVYGSGFEHQPETIAAIGQHYADIRQSSRDAAARQGSAHCSHALRSEWRAASVISLTAARRAATLVEKEARRGRRRAYRRGRGASGGLPDYYFQRRVAGESISALFLANGKEAEIVGLSVQWTAPTPASPFRYGGAAGPVDANPAQTREIARIVALIASELKLVGLNSADFLVSADAVWLIEVNPRPGATLDVFESNEDALFTRHVAACEGRLTPASPSLPVKAAEIVYAPCDLLVGRGSELAGLDRRPTVARNAHRRRRSRVHHARFWRHPRIGADLRR